MVDLGTRKPEFIDGLVKTAGWNKEDAKEHFMHYAPLFEIGNATEFILSETKRLRNRHSLITIALLFYLVEDNKLCFIREN